MGCNRCRSRVWLLALAAGFVSALAACGSRPPPVAATANAPAASAAPAPMPVARPLTVNHQTWTAEAMEALLAPIALYPDPVLSQVLMAATNPQEVLDAGNWLIDHPNLADKALDQAAAAAGFTPPMRALMQFRPVVDQMCLKMGWTAELGQAFTNDQAGVLAAVQRLRRQAQEAGNLADSPQMAVETQDQGGQDTIVISPPSPHVVYVPQYDPMTAYAPAPEIETESDGTGEMVATGVLAYGAGLIVGNVFDHDADNYYHHRYYYPNYVYGRYPPCPVRHYRPAYGHGHRPGHYYNRPPHYEDTLRDNNLLVVDHRGDDYWNHFDERPADRPRPNSAPSPITVASLYRAPPAEFEAERSVPTRWQETMNSTPERRQGYPGQMPNADAQGQRSTERDRRQHSHEDAQSARLQEGDREPAQYSAAPERRARGGDREQPAHEGGQSLRPYERDRGEQHRMDIKGARPQVEAREPPHYGAAPQRDGQGGDRQPSAHGSAAGQQSRTDVRPGGSASTQPRQTSPAARGNSGAKMRQPER